MIKMEIPNLMTEQYKQAKHLIESSKDIKVYSHIDCDGICSGAILSTILDRLGKVHEIEFVNLDVLDDIELNHELTIFSDLGSGQRIDTNAEKNNSILILDHHPPLRNLDYKNTKDWRQFCNNANYINSPNIPKSTLQQNWRYAEHTNRSF